MSGIFTYIDNSVSTVLGKTIAVTQTNLANSITGLLSASLTLYIIVYGYMVLADKIQSPFKELMWKLASFVIIIAFLQNSGGLLELAGKAVDQLSTIGTDGSAGVGFLDDQYKRMGQLADQMSDRATTGTGWFVNGLVLFAYVFMAVPIFSILIISKFTMFFLLAIAPLFIFCLMWGWLKDSFAQYLTAVLSNALVVIIARTLQKSFFDIFEKINSLQDVNVYFLAFCFVIVAWFSKELLVYIISSVSKLVRVTADSFPNSFSSVSARETARAEAKQLARENARDQVQQQILQQLKNLNKK